MLDQILVALSGLTAEEKTQVLQTLLSADTRLEKIKSLLGIKDADQDTLIEFTMKTVENMILQYINWKVLPETLEGAYLLMCVSYCKSAGLGESSAVPGAITSVKRGDVQTTYAASAAGSSGTFNLGADQGDFFGWRTVLNGYRKLRK